MSALTRTLLVALPFILSSLVLAETDTKQSKAADKQSRTEKAVATAPAEARPTTMPAGSVGRALTELYRIPRGAQPRQFGRSGQGAIIVSPKPSDQSSKAAPRPFGTAGRGDAPRQTITEQNRMGYQHSDSIRNSVSQQPIGDPLRQPAGDGHIVKNSPTGPAVPRENSLSAYNWGPYRDEAYSNGQGSGEAVDNGNAGGNSNGGESDDYRFGFTQGYAQGRWAQRGGARVQSVLSHANDQLSRGLAAFRAGEYRTAVKYFKLASDMNQGDPSAMIYSAHALFAIGRYQESAVYLRKAFTLEPRISMLTYDMRDDYRNPDDFVQQVRALNNAVADSPRDLDRLTVLGYVLNYSDQPDQAFAVLAKARALAPKDKVVQLLYQSTNPPDVTR